MYISVSHTGKSFYQHRVFSSNRYKHNHRILKKTFFSVFLSFILQKWLKCKWLIKQPQGGTVKGFTFMFRRTQHACGTTWSSSLCYCNRGRPHTFHTSWLFSSLGTGFAWFQDCCEKRLCFSPGIQHIYDHFPPPLQASGLFCPSGTDFQCFLT